MKNLVFCGRKAISLNIQILVALKKVTKYRLLFNHHLINNLIFRGRIWRRKRRSIYRKKIKADQSLKPTHLINKVVKHFYVLYTMCHEMKDKNICCSTMKLLWQIAQLPYFGIQSVYIATLLVCLPLHLSYWSLVSVFLLFILKVLQSTSYNTQPCCLVEHLFSPSFQEHPLVAFHVQVCIRCQRPLK